ncbi:MAG: hypothetical protein CL872_00640 [Dehalococcoidaceae bacterium]|nr:hypothetical protein [Dehalococcoidaceae bacterium]|tara:strand:- start:4852 stop:6339 length:1488 start_codon:yes stop_codon:yes gene_type:complete
MKKRILFFLNNDISKFGIIKKLQEKFDAEYYGIIDVTNKPRKFFEHQHLVEFEKTWFYHDHVDANGVSDKKFLEDFEKKYSLNLWNLVYSERIFHNFNEFYKFREDEILSILSSEGKFFEDILQKINPDFIIMPAPIFHHEFLLYDMCKKLSITTLILRATRFANKSMISEHYELLDYKGHQAPISRTLDELLDYKKQFNVYDSGNQFRDTFLKSRTKLFKAAFEYIFANNNSNQKSHYTYFGRNKLKVLCNFIIDRMKVSSREHFIDNNLTQNPSLEENFLFFPLHIEQEVSLLNFAPYYMDQINVIKNIAKSLPINFQLYVKEHPSQKLRSWRKISIYKELLGLQNVKVIHPSVKPDELLKNCKMVVSISGTSALESSFFNKPSIIFSDVVFSELSWIKRLDSFEKLNEKIKTSLEMSVNQDELNNYVDYIIKNSFDYDNDNFSVMSQEFFHHGGFLVDTNIEENQMKQFIEKHDKIFSKIAEEFLKKIQLKS